MLDDLRDDISSDMSYWENQLESDLNRICNGCKPIVDRLPLEHHGTPCAMEYAMCEPGENCKRAGVYDELCRLLDVVRAAIAAVENKVEAVA